MPILNSAQGKIKSLLIFDDDASTETVAVTRAIAEVFGPSVDIYYLIYPDETGILDTASIEALPCQVKPYIYKGARKKEAEKLVRAHKRVTDFVVPCVDPSTGQPILYFKASLMNLQEGFADFFSSFNIKALSDISPVNKPGFYHIEGGDYISGSDFFIVGPNSYFDRRTAMNGNVYWKSFFKHFYSASFTKKQVLKLAPIPKYARVWKRPDILYHLDLYLTYTGKEESGREHFYLGEIGKQAYLRSPQYCEAYNLINAYLQGVASQLFDFFRGNVVIKRIPLVPNAMDPMNATDGSIFSYNNALVEVAENAKKFVLPVYNISIDERIKAIESLKERFDQATQIATVEVPTYYVEIKAQSLHCFVCVLERC